MRTCRLYRDVDSNPPQLSDLLGDLVWDTYIPPYGYFDRPRILHKVAVALWARFQQDMNLDDLKKSIELNKEALHLIPDGHDDQATIVACLGRSFLKQVETLGNATDVDTSVDLAELGDRVVTALNHVSSKKEELCEQIALVLTVDATIQCIEGEAPSPRIPVIQSLVDQWHEENGIQTRCKRQLGVLLSFLAGEGETMMYELLAKIDWPFKGYKTEETVQVLQNYMRCMRDSFESGLGVMLRTAVLIRGSVDDIFKVCSS